MLSLLTNLLKLTGLKRLSFSLSWAFGKCSNQKEGEMVSPSNPSDYDPAKMLKGMTTSRDFAHAHPELVKRFKELAESYERMFPGRKVLVTCTYRSPEEQQRLYKQGRLGNPGNIVTNVDGFNKKSNHNHFPSRAIDCCITEGGKAVWDEAVYWPLGALSKHAYLEWGGNWPGLKDYPHLELPRDVK